MNANTIKTFIIKRCNERIKFCELSNKADKYEAARLMKMQVTNLTGAGMLCRYLIDNQDRLRDIMIKHSAYSKHACQYANKVSQLNEMLQYAEGFQKAGTLHRSIDTMVMRRGSVEFGVGSVEL